MNTKNLHQIFANYIDRFEELNGTGPDETFKWWAAAQFRALMDDALRKSENAFVDVLQTIVSKDVVGVIIDGRMRPFRGLVEIAKDKKYTERVKELFLSLFKDDGGDLAKREKKIAVFLRESEKLRLEKFPKYYSYKQTARSVAGYLFLYDPNHHYMYKATEASRFADDVEYYGDWGYGNQIKLREYYRMCDELVSEIQKCQELLETDKSRETLKSRFENDKHYGKLLQTAEIMAKDENHHILAYDIIYCNKTYNLDRNLSFKNLLPKDKKLYEERLKKAQEAQEKYIQTEECCQQLEEARQHYNAILLPGVKVQHRIYGEGVVTNREKDNIIVQFESGILKYDLYKTIAEGYLKFDDSLDEDRKQRYRELCKNRENILTMRSIRQKVLEEYSDILE